MRARTVNENISFERGLDPKESMGLGYYIGKEIDFAYMASRHYGSTKPNYYVKTTAKIEDIMGDILVVNYSDEYGRHQTRKIKISDLNKNLRSYENEREEYRLRMNKSPW
jgi:hypothetical protein